jgi:hypothetical protein
MVSAVSLTAAESFADSSALHREGRNCTVHRTLLSLNVLNLEFTIMPDTESNKPVFVIRRRGVKAAVFLNRSGDNEFFKVTIQKIYRDDSGNWKTTTSFTRDDLPLVSLLAQKAWERILENGESNPSSVQSLSENQSHSDGTIQSQSEGMNSTQTEHISSSTTQSAGTHRNRNST